MTTSTQFPDNYCKDEIECIFTALHLRRSLQLVGWDGVGKSTLIRYLMENPERLSTDVALTSEDVSFLYIDCGGLSEATPLCFYQECCYKMDISDDDIDKMNAEFWIRNHLEREITALSKNKFVIIIIEQVAIFSDDNRKKLFRQLLNLRNAAQPEQLAYILSSPRPIEDLYDLGTIFSSVCWVRPLNDTDQTTSIERHQTRLDLKLNEKEQERLKVITGGFPGFLKSCLEYIKTENIHILEKTDEELVTLFLDRALLQAQSRRLWEALTETEQLYLVDFETPLRPNTVPPVLLDSGLVIETTAGEPRIFSDLWATYLKAYIIPQEPNRPLQIRILDASREIVLYWRGRSETVALNRRLVFRLFNILAEDAGEVVDKETLIRHLYPLDEPEHITDDSIFQLITALRNEIDIPVKRLCPTLSESFVQNVRGAGYRLLVDLPLERKPKGRRKK
ncbi:MAG: winged helix-turn-helix domain-containing protein [Chloroflexota bacterium]